MASDRNEEIRNALDKLYAHLDEVKRDTRKKLGIDALHIVDLHANNWIDLCRGLDRNTAEKSR